MIPFQRASKWILFAIMALSFFIYFHTQHPFLREIELKLDNMPQDSIPAMVQWDSGHGFNELEKKVISQKDSIKAISLPQYSILSIRLEWSSATEDSMPLPEIQACWQEKCEMIPHMLLSRNNNSLIVAIKDSDRTILIPRLMAIQILLSILMTMMLIWLIKNIYSISQSHGLWNYCLAFLSTREGRFFCFSFVVSFSVFLAWQLAYWPGSMTQLSYMVWDRTRTLQFDRTTGWYYQVILVAMNQIYDSPFTTTLLNALLYPLLACSICSYSIKNGGMLISVLCLMIFLAFPHITAWSTVLWYDIPYSILVVACAAFIFWLFFEQRYYSRIYRPSNAALVLLIFLFISLILLRRNGVLFLLLVPALLTYLKLMERRRRHCFIILSALMYLTLEFGVTHVLKVEQATSKYMSPELLSQIQWKMNPLFSLFTRKEGYVSDDYEADRKIIEKLLPLELIKKHYSPNTIETTFWISNHFLAPEDIAAINSLYYRRLLPNFRILLNERLHLFFNNLRGFFFVNRLEKPQGPPLVYYPNCWNLRFESRWPWFHNLTQTFLSSAINNKLMRAMFLNPLLAMVMLVLLVFCYRKVPASALYSFVVLFQIPFLFIVVPGAESRYFYFVHIGALLTAPLVYLELATKRKTTHLRQRSVENTTI